MASSRCMISGRLLLLAFLIAAMLNAQPPAPARAVQQQTSSAVSSPMPLVAPLFIEDDQRNSTITMVNSAPEAVEVDVVIYSLSGDQVAKQAVTVGPHSQRSLAVSNLVEGRDVRSGSVFLVPHRATTMGAQLSIATRNGIAPNDVEEEFQMMMGSRPANFRAVSVAASPLIAVRNVNSEQQLLSVTCLHEDGGGRATSGTISIGPNRTLLIDACTESGPRTLPTSQGIAPKSSDGRKAVAISVSSPVASMELAVFGLGAAGDHKDGGLVAVPFTDVNDLNSSTAVFPGVIGASSNFRRLQAAIANFGSASHDATIQVSRNIGSASTVARRLPPNSVSLLASKTR